MLNVSVPLKYHTDQRVLRPLSCIGMGATASQDKGGRIVWAVTDRTAEVTNPVDYREYDWSGDVTLCFGADDEILADTDKIKPEHDVVTIPGLRHSLYLDQAMAIILEHYRRNYM